MQPRFPSFVRRIIYRSRRRSLHARRNYVAILYPRPPVRAMKKNNASARTSMRNHMFRCYYYSFVLRHHRNRANGGVAGAGAAIPPSSSLRLPAPPAVRYVETECDAPAAAAACCCRLLRAACYCCVRNRRKTAASSVVDPPPSFFDAYAVRFGFELLVIESDAWVQYCVCVKPPLPRTFRQKIFAASAPAKRCGSFL